MANLDRVRIGWAGPGVVGPGVSTFYFPAGGGAAGQAALKTFFTAIQSAFPNTAITWTFPAGGETINAANGALVGAWSGATPSSLTAAASNPDWLAGVGARIAWNTDAVSRGRRVRGSTFLVPLNGSASSSDGTIVNTYVTSLQTAATALVTGADHTIWSRPSAPGLSDGGSSTVTSATVPDRVSWLRSRRT